MYRRDIPMNHTDNSILVINAGSSSLKANVYIDQISVLSIHIDKIGHKESSINIEADHESYENILNLSFDSALDKIDDLILDHKMSPSSVGYRVVHGGPRLTGTTILDENVLQELQSLQNIDPEHTPNILKAIDHFKKAYPYSTHIVCFDTTFFRNLPLITRRLPIPVSWHKKGIHRYGFHGLSYTYILAELGRIYGDEASMGKIIVAHMGSGVSVAALKQGKPIDTTMSYSPTSGVVMSTRSGSIDPSILWRMVKEGVSSDEIQDELNNKSGLLGISELSADMQILIENYDTHEKSKLAVDMFCYEIKKTIGAYSAAMGGLDKIIFTGGMGENAPFIRKKIIADLEYLGVKLNKTLNETSVNRISTDESKVGVYVMHTDESVVIAQEVHKIISQKRQQ